MRTPRQAQPLSAKHNGDFAHQPNGGKKNTQSSATLDCDPGLQNAMRHYRPAQPWTARIIF